MLNCRLCGKRKALCESHIVPSLVGKWLKKTGATGFFTGINTESGQGRRSQDLHKPKLLCKDCEIIFSKLETYFASKIFHPYQENSLEKIERSDSLGKFVLSLSLRVLWVMREDNHPLVHENVVQVNILERNWKQYLSGENVEPKSGHYMFLSQESLLAKGLKVAPNLMSNTFRSSFFDIREYFDVVFIYVNMAGIQTVSLINQSTMPDTRGTMVLPKQTLGVEQPATWWRGFLLNGVEISNHIDKLRIQLPQRERDRIVKAERKNPNRVINSQDAEVYESQERHKAELLTPTERDET